MKITITIPTYESFAYSEVWLVFESRDGCIYSTKFTGKYCLNDTKLPKGYVTASISTSRLKQDTLTMEMWEDV